MRMRLPEGHLFDRAFGGQSVTAEQKAVQMNPKRESLMLAGAQVLVLLMCLGAMIWNVASGMIFDIDGLLLLTISLALAAVFSFTLLLHAKSEGWLEKLPMPGRKKAAAAESSPAAAVKVPGGDAK